MGVVIGFGCINSSFLASKFGIRGKRLFFFPYFIKFKGGSLR
jgi:hypothetical protein